MVVKLVFILLEATGVNGWDKFWDKALEGLIAIPILLLVLWAAKKFFEKIFEVFLENVKDTREEYQTNLQTKEQQILSIVNSKEAIVKAVTDSFKETSEKMLLEHTKQIEILVKDARVGNDNYLSIIKAKDSEITSSYQKNTEVMEKFQDIVKNVLDDQRNFQEKEREHIGKMMHDMEMRINQKLQAR